MVFPIRLLKVVFVNMLFAMTKSVLPPHIKDVFEVGCQIEWGHTLDEIYLTPDADTACQRVLENVSNALKLRYENEKMYSLKEDSVMIAADG